MDYMRGTRKNRKGESSLTLLNEIGQEHPDKRTRFSFYHKPGIGFLKGKYINGPLREMFGTLHIKAFVFDDHVMISGANLDENYFSHR